jgi:hypothetical protein
MRTAERLAPTLMRVTGGLLFAGLGALAGMALAGISLPPGSEKTYLLAARVLFIGFGATAGAFLPWWRPGEATGAAALRFSLTVAGARAGPLAGLAFAEVIQEHYDPLRRVQQISRTMVFGAGIGANIPPLFLDLGAILPHRSR